MGHWWQQKHCLVMGQEGQHRPPIFQQLWAGFYTRPTTAVAAFDSSGKKKVALSEAPGRARAPDELLNSRAPWFAQACRQDRVGFSLQLEIQTLLQAWAEGCPPCLDASNQGCKATAISHLRAVSHAFLLCPTGQLACKHFWSQAMQGKRSDLHAH